jgi:hypothetical protein
MGCIIPSRPQRHALNSASDRPRCARQGRCGAGRSGEGMADRKAARGGGSPAAPAARSSSNATHVPALWPMT